MNHKILIYNDSQAIKNLLDRIDINDGGITMHHLILKTIASIEITKTEFNFNENGEIIEKIFNTKKRLKLSYIEKYKPLTVKEKIFEYSDKT